MLPLARFAHLVLALVLAVGLVAPAARADHLAPPATSLPDVLSSDALLPTPLPSCEAAPELCDLCGATRSPLDAPYVPEYDPSLVVDPRGCAAPPPLWAMPCRAAERFQVARFQQVVRSPAEEMVLQNASSRAAAACRAIGEAHASGEWVGMAVFATPDPTFPRWHHYFYLPLTASVVSVEDTVGGTLRFLYDRGRWRLRAPDLAVDADAPWIDLQLLPHRFPTP